MPKLVRDNTFWKSRCSKSSYEDWNHSSYTAQQSTRVKHLKVNLCKSATKSTVNKPSKPTVQMYKAKELQTKIRCGSSQSTLQSTVAPALRSPVRPKEHYQKPVLGASWLQASTTSKYGKPRAAKFCIEEVFHLRTLGAETESLAGPSANPPKQTTKSVAHSQSN